VKYFLWSIFILLAAITARAQYHNTGTLPATVSWRQIKTEKFTVIYPREIDSIAQRYAWLLDNSYRSVQAPLRADVQHVPVVLYPHNVYSNGMVVWTPRRMELFTTPPVNSYAQMWDKQLALHETRHVAQMSQLHKGFFKGLHYFIGEQAEGIAAGIYLTKWFLEGDATVAETAGSNSGRGRQAEFLMPIKAFVLSGYNFSWDTWINSSYRYNIPNEYQLGYLLASYAYRQAGETIFGDMLEYTTHHPFNIPPPSRALKKYGGFWERELFEQSFAHLKEEWQREDTEKMKNVLPVRELTRPVKNGSLSYRSAIAIDSATLLAVRTDLEHPQQLVTVDNNGNEQFVRYLGLINSSLKKGGDNIYWSVPVSHERWEQKSFSIIKSYHIPTKKTTILTHRTRYYSPVPSPDGWRLAVIENTPQGENFITLLSTYDNTDTATQRIAFPAGQIPREIVWDNDGMKLYCTIISDEGLALKQYDLQHRQWSELLPPGIATVNKLTNYNDFILFESGYNGTNNIYALHTQSKNIFRITDARFGAFDPAVSADNTQLLFSNYVATGYTIASQPIDQNQWTETTFTTPKRFAIADTLSAMNRYNIDTLTIPENPYNSKRYSGFAHLFNIHSWAPFYFHPDALKSASLDVDMLEQVGLGATVLSQNVLGTLTSRAAYKYKNGFNSGHFFFAYRGFYPVIDFSMNVNERHRTISTYVLDEQDNRIKYYIAEMAQPYINTSIRMYIPFNLTHGAWQTGFTPQASYQFENDEYRSMKNGKFQYMQSMTVGATFYRQLSRAVRDIFPRWGFSLRALYSFPVFNDNIYPAASIQAGCYIPGFFANHGISFTASYVLQTHRDELRYSFFKPVSFPRGYETFSTKELVKFTFDYSFPLFYPDWNIGWLAYFKRFRMNVFSDYSQWTLFAQKQNLLSVGADLLADFHVFRFGFPVAAGVRYAQPLTGARSPAVSLLLDITI